VGRSEYKNGLKTGEADYNGGNPVVSFNVDTLVRYNGIANGINFVVLHELAHMTDAAMDYYYELFTAPGDYMKNGGFERNERFANDIARAIANHSNMDVLSREDAAGVKGYSPGDAKLFVAPGTGSNGGSGTGGSGGWGGGGGSSRGGEMRLR